MLPLEILRCIEEFPLRNIIRITTLGDIGQFKVSHYVAEDILARSKDETVFLAIGITDIVNQFSNQSDFMRNNPGLLYVDIGFFKKDSLKESGISGYISEESKELMGLIKFFKRRLKKGGRAINPETGSSVSVPSHYYSEGAYAFEKNGGKLLALAGTSLYSVIDS
jgi:hypothetical protein